ncbi:YveK family protein [Mycolicibacterium pulveris]|uniref:YveK family protein n=1 Tax=Mycolicibacterium pulveris TaxID=36813 RepID=UPI003CFAA01E
MRPPAEVPRIRDYLRLLLNGWAVLLCATVVSAASGWLAWQSASPVYTSTARVFAVTPGGATPVDAYYGQLNAVSRNVTTQHLARSRQVTIRTIEQLDLEMSPAELAARITVTATNSALLEVAVVGSDPDLTRRTADGVTQNLVALINEMAAVDTGSAELVVVDAAEPAVRQGSVWQFIVPAGAVGFVLSAVLVLAYGLLRDRMHGTRQLDHVVDEALTGRDR